MIKVEVVLLVALIVLFAMRHRWVKLDLRLPALAWIAGQAWSTAFVLIPTVDLLTNRINSLKLVERFGEQGLYLLCAALLFSSLAKSKKVAAED